uniref:Uncharacterized protein n=1 Tax=Brassica campestris TaxID=3711 RepID=M4F1K2_BRACM
MERHKQSNRKEKRVAMKRSEAIRRQSESWRGESRWRDTAREMKRRGGETLLERWRDEAERQVKTRETDYEIPELTEPKVSKPSLSPFTVKDIAPPKLPRGHNRQSPKINRHQTLTTAAARDLRRNRSLSLNVLHSIHGGEERDSNQRETNRKRTAIPFDRSTDTKNSSIYRR